MKRPTRNRWIWLVTAGAAVLLALALPGHALAHGPATGGVPKDKFDGLFRITLWISIPVFLLVEGLLLFAILRYRRRSHDEMPEQVHGNTRLEILWTVIPFIIIAILFLITLRAFGTDYKVTEGGEDVTSPDLTVHVIGYMFNWDFEYFKGEGEQTGVITTRDLKVPAGKAVYLEITSTDVQHSFWVPQLAGKVDAVPGQTNTMWLHVDKTGHYTGQCAEYCGLNHYAMLIDVDVMEPAAFDAWLTEQSAAASEFTPIGQDMETPLPAGDAARGEQVFTDLACGACHAPEKDQSSGPGIARMHVDAEERVESGGYASVEDYLRQSILMPCEVLAHGYEQCIMPQDYGQKLDARRLADLIEYLKNQYAASEHGDHEH